MQEGRELVADLNMILMGGLSSGFSMHADMLEEAVMEWAGSLRRRTMMLAQFGPTESVRDAADEVWTEVRDPRRSDHVRQAGRRP